MTMKRIFDLIGWLGTAIVAVAVALAMVPALNNYAQYSRPLAIAGLVCVLVYVAGLWQEFAKLFSRRQARYGALLVVNVVVVLGILILINVIGKSQNKRWDLTANKQFSLSDQSRNILTKLDSPLQITVYTVEPEFDRFRDRLKEYEYTSKKVTTEYVDADKKRAMATQNGITQIPTIVFSYKGRNERVTSDTEQDITNGIIKAVSGQQRKIYFTQGHGEKDTGSAERDGYGTIAKALGAENYTTEKVVLAQQGSVPDDATVVVVAGPRNDFFQPEIDAIKKYLDKGGKLLLELDPPEKAEAAPLTNLIALAHDWGVQVGNNVVVDVSGMGRLFGTDASVPVAANYPPHAITSRFNIMTAYPLAREAAPVSGGVNGHTAQVIVESSPRSWAEVDIKALFTSGQVSLDEAKGDKKGPIALMSAVNAPIASATPPKPGDDTPKPETRVVVVGDSDFAENTVLGIPGNRDLFMNIVGWLSQQENLISIRPKEADDRRVTLTERQQSNIVWLSLLVIPGFVFGTGVYAWWRRR
jgi:gliding motility-associatede transport system auxiliary component